MVEQVKRLIIVSEVLLDTCCTKQQEIIRTPDAETETKKCPSRQPGESELQPHHCRSYLPPFTSTTLEGNCINSEH